MDCKPVSPSRTLGSCSLCLTNRVSQQSVLRVRDRQKEGWGLRDGDLEDKGEQNTEDLSFFVRLCSAPLCSCWFIGSLTITKK